MKKRILTAVLCAAALAAAGCAGQGTDAKGTGAAASDQGATAEAAAEDEADASAEGTTVSEAAAGSTAGTTAAESAAEQESKPSDWGEKYESEDGWSVRYDSDLVSEEETSDSVIFTYTGECSGTNNIEISYIPYTSTDIVLADKLADYEDSQVERSEGYFAGRTDIWAFSADVIPEWSSTRGYTAVEYNDGVLLIDKRGYEESDEELGAEIAGTMADILNSFEFEDFHPQVEYDYIPGKYTLNLEALNVTEEGYTGDYPKQILMRVDHTGTITVQDTVDIVWYCRDSLIKENYSGGETYYYNIEGDSLYLQQGEDYIEYIKDTTGGAAEDIKAQSTTVAEADGTKSGGGSNFATYENSEGWLVYYDKDMIDVSEEYGAVDLVYADSPDGEDKLEFSYHPYDSTEDVLEDVARGYDPETLGSSEGFLGGRHDAWGFTVVLPADENGDGTEQTYTAVEHNGGTLLIEKILRADAGEEEKEKIGKVFDDILNTFMFTAHDPQTEYEEVPGKYLLNDRILQKDASNYPSEVRLNDDHTGVFKWPEPVDIIWHARDGIIREAASDGASYEYRLDDDTLYIIMDGEQVEFEREDEDDDDWDDD